MNNVKIPQEYKVQSQDFIEEIASDVYLLEHVKSGARVMLMPNKDDNKVFSASFKTIPEDDTGLAHIMEHSVLCGSEKYPVKEPFVELMKGSLNTYLNAMTFADKTMYPIASRNEQDFHNLMDVYLDAVFFPKLSKEAFLQEGWHYEVDDKGKLQYSGVVYNEMKGVYSSAESTLVYELNRATFPDSPYFYESGGLPAAIPELTYETYLAFHEECYHPSNSYIHLYGDFAVEATLAQLDGYLNRFDAREVDLPIFVQKRFAEPKEIYSTYPADESEKGEAYLSLNWLLDSSLTQGHHLEWGILNGILLSSSASILRKALVDSELGEDVLAYGFDCDALESSFCLGLKRSSATKKEAFESLVLKTLRDVVRDGIPKKLIRAAMTSMEFQLREANYGSYPKGLIYSINSLTTWLYGDDACGHLYYEEYLADLKEKVASGPYFEQLIEKYLLNNSHRILMVCEADIDFMKKLAEAEQEELAKVQAGLSEDELKAIVRQKEDLLDAQDAPDSPEALATMPQLTREALEDKPEDIPSEEVQFASLKGLYHEVPANGIIYSQICFDASSLSADEQQDFALMSELLMKVGTKNFTYDDWVQELACELGSLGASASYASHLDESLLRHFTLSAKLLPEQLPSLTRLLEEVLLNIDFADKVRFQDLIRIRLTQLRQSLQNNGSQTAQLEASAQWSALGFWREQTSGRSFLAYLTEIQENFDQRYEELCLSFQKIKKKLFNQSHALINLTCDQKDVAAFRAEAEKWQTFLGQETYDASTLPFKASKKNIGITCPSQVQYVCQMANVHQLGFKFDGSFDLLYQYLTTSYLWDNIRVKGGAYGCHLSFDRLIGSLSLCSYRDPRLEETLAVYDGIAEAIENLNFTQEELDKLLIGTVGRLEGVLTASQKGNIALRLHLSGVDYQLRCQRRRELLDCDLERLRSYAKVFTLFKDNAVTTVQGPEEKLKAVEIFDQYVKVD